MLKKLLKYDFKSVFKFWWIGAVSSLVLSLLAGGCITVLRVERKLPAVVDASAGIFIALSVIGLVVFSVLSAILVYVRFYKNFFTDEGYLTFTLPVKVGSLLNSKLIMGVVTIFATLVMLCIDAFVIFGIGFGDKIFTQEVWQAIVTLWNEMTEYLGWYTLVYALEGVLMVALVIIFSHLFLNCCITLAAVITKKARVITAIGIYYGVKCVVSFVLQLFLMFGIEGVAQRLTDLTTNQLLPVVALIFLGILVFELVVCSLLYTFQYWMLDRKLNLA